MIHTRINKSETTVEIIDINEIAFLRGKLEDRKYKVQVFLKHGTIIHMNLDKDEFQKLRDVFSNITRESMDKNVKSLTPIPWGMDSKPQIPGLSEVAPVTLDDLLTDSPEGSK